MRATTLSALVLLLAAGALRADPPGVLERIEGGGGSVERAGPGPGTPAVVVWMPAGTADADLAALCELRSLRALDLSCTPVTDAGLATIAELRGLRVLDLNGTRVSDAGLRRLEALTGLRRLDLASCPGVTDAGVERLRKALPYCEVRR